jgi:hypothetical protein
LPRLRDAPNDLFALVGEASEAMGLPQEFVEKDFWITELLRSVAEPVADAFVVFKGGTSLSKAFGLLERFSEDVDILLVVTRPFDKAFGKGSVDKILKRFCERTGEHLGIETDRQQLESSRTGQHRSMRYDYPARVVPEYVKRGVLLEIGVRGGPDPHQDRMVRSFVAEHAIGSLGVDESDYEEFALVPVPVLNAERTLFEKLALLHHLGATYPDSAQKLRGAGHHLYDVSKILNDETARSILESTPGLAAKMAEEIDENSERWGWPHTPRPREGYGASPIFDSAHPCKEAVRAGYEAVRTLVYGSLPSLEESLGLVRRNATLL